MEIVHSYMEPWGQICLWLMQTRCNTGMTAGPFGVKGLKLEASGSRSKASYTHRLFMQSRSNSYFRFVVGAKASHIVYMGVHRNPIPTCDPDAL